MKLLPLFLLLSCHLIAQKKPALPALPDIAALQKMTPAQLEAYKQKMLKQYSRRAKEMAEEQNLKVNEMVLPDFSLKPPAKDLKRLATLPPVPPAMPQLLQAVQQSKKDLESITPKAVLDEVKSITAAQTPAQQQGSSMGAFYAGKPVEALLLSMHSVLQTPDTLIAWNNLAALYNMSGLEHKAVPILMRGLQQEPANALLLNNMGQAYLGLGELNKAEDYLQQCLAQDALNPEANRGMGMIKFFQDRFDEGLAYFEKELEISHRRSTLALLKQKGKPANLYKLRLKRPDRPQRNYFEEINLAGFVMPEFPKTSDASRTAQAKAKGFLQSVTAEMLFWNRAATEPFTQEEVSGMRYNNASIYSDLVDELLDGLHTSFPAENMALLTPSDITDLKARSDAYNKRRNEIQCPSPPLNSSPEAILAYQQKCCDMTKPVIDAHVQDWNAFVSARISTVQPRWKDYINSLISIIRLDPAPGRKRMVYASVAQYFSFLVSAWQSGVFPDPEGCKTDMTPEEATAIIESSRKIDFSCPGWLNLSIGLGVASLKANCNSYSIEGGEFLQGAYEKNFATGTSTLAGGVGVGANFNGILKAGASQMVYVTWDNNNGFTDVGLRGGASLSAGWKAESLITDGIGKLSGQIAGINGGYSLGLNSGFSASVKGKGLLQDFIKLETHKSNWKRISKS